MDDLWPAGIGEEIIDSPDKILGNQNEIIFSRTQGAINLNVSEDIPAGIYAFLREYFSTSKDLKFFRRYGVTAPKVSYSTFLFTIAYPIFIYPCAVFYETKDEELLEKIKPYAIAYTSGDLGILMTANSDEQLKNILRSVFSLTETIKTINSLVSLSKS